MPLCISILRLIDPFILLLKKLLIVDSLLSDSFNVSQSNLSTDLTNPSFPHCNKSKILNTNLKFNFAYNESSLNIYNSFFRSKNLSFKNKSLITLKPFLDSNSKFEIENIDVEIFKKLKIDKLLKSKDILKKINTKNEVNFNSKKFSSSFFDKLNLKFDLAYGRLNYSKKLSILDDIFQCMGNINLLEEFPLLFFDCSINSKKKKRFFKKF